MKKIIKYNFIFVFTALIFLEIFSYIKVYCDNKEMIKSHTAFYHQPAVLTYDRMLYPKYRERTKYFRPVSYGNDKTKRPIALFGCSYTWGSMLNEDETFSAVLSKYTGRTVYNRGLYAAGVPFFYYQLSMHNTRYEIKNSEYIIYTLIDSHFYRMLTIRSWCKDPVLQYRYILENGKLKLIEPHFPQLYGFYSVFIISQFIQNLKYEHEDYKDIFITLMEESNKLIKKRFPNTKFVILVYQDKYWKYDKTKHGILKQLEDDGIEIIYTDDLIGKGALNDNKYLAPDGFHPSKEAWKLIVPALIKKLNL